MTTKKMAIFAEGMTEVEFDSKLINELASPRAITIETNKIRGGGKSGKFKKSIESVTVKQSRASEDSTHYFMLYDCGNDDGTKTRMMDEYDNLVKAGYTKILCHRDLSPTWTAAHLPRLHQLNGLPFGVKTKPIVVTFILSVMEVEAWFLAEHLHFPLIEPRITVDAIRTSLGFDPSQDDMQLRATPAVDLGACYAIGGQLYDKYDSSPTINAIDCANVAMEVRSKFSYLDTLCNEITSFLDN